ncbi:unnamed protein product [Closterium sp. NIES-64]|nr:unnamed protein product [Closterium sp. NIES-64]
MPRSARLPHALVAGNLSAHSALSARSGFSAPIQGACVRFSLADILTATNHWAPHLLVGNGYRLMFKGVDPRDGVTLWLLKICRARESEEFQAEVAEMGYKNHPNLVRLLGYCDERDKQGRWEKVVVYEFMTAGSLHDMFQPAPFSPLALLVCCECAVSVLCVCCECAAKIAGFDYVTTRRAAASGEQHAVVGVRGYVDPHLLLTQEHTPTNDLYSLGVVLLQLLSGRISDASGKTMPEFFREAVSIEGERI